MKTTIALICSVLLMVTPATDFNVKPDDITFEVKSKRVTPKSVTLTVECPEEISWDIEYPPGFGGEKSGVGPGYLAIYPLGDLSHAKDESDLIFKSELGTKKVHISVEKEKPINFDMRVFPEKRIFHPGGSGVFTILLTCPDKNICGRIRFTEPAEHVSGRVAVVPNFLTPPGVATVGMSSSSFTNPNSFSLPVRANSKNRKASGTIKSEVVKIGKLPAKPSFEISTTEISFIPGIDENEKFIEITPLADEKIFYWEATPNKSWIDFEPKQGKGKGKIKVTLFHNGLTNDVDEGSITLTFPGLETIEKEILVKLLPNPTDHFFVSPEVVQIGPPETMYKAPTITIDVLPNVSWEVKNIPGWLSVAPTSGQGTSTVLCTVIEESKEVIFRENELSIQLKNFPSEVRIINVQHISPKSFLPDSLILKSSGNIFTGQMICKSFDNNEILIVRQPSNGWFTWINTSELPKIKLHVRRIWGDDTEKILTIYRLRPAFNPQIFYLRVTLSD